MKQLQKLKRKVNGNFGNGNNNDTKNLKINVIRKKLLNCMVTYGRDLVNLK